VSREVTSPILQGGGVREADEVDYRFDFPDKTTGVAFSARQTGGDRNISGYAIFGNVNSANNTEHGVLMDKRGLNEKGKRGWIKVTRNSDDNGSLGTTPKDETIDRFQVQDYGLKDYRNPTRIFRQIAIHTQPHTATQLSDLKSNYLTQP